MRMTTKTTQAGAIAKAIEMETNTSRPHYAVRWYDGTYEITSEKPRMGRYFTTDGIRHGDESTRLV